MLGALWAARGKEEWWQAVCGTFGVAKGPLPHVTQNQASGNVCMCLCGPDLTKVMGAEVMAMSSDCGYPTVPPVPSSAPAQRGIPLPGAAVTPHRNIAVPVVPPRPRAVLGAVPWVQPADLGGHRGMDTPCSSPSLGDSPAPSSTRAAGGAGGTRGCSGLLLLPWEQLR